MRILARNVQNNYASEVIDHNNMKFKIEFSYEMVTKLTMYTINENGLHTIGSKYDLSGFKEMNTLSLTNGEKMAIALYDLKIAEDYIKQIF